MSDSQQPYSPASMPPPSGVPPFAPAPYGAPEGPNPSMQYPPAAPSAKPGNGLGLAALIVGICAFIGAFIPFINYVSGFLAVVGIILGVIAITRKNKPKKAGAAGLIVSVIAVLLSIVLAITYTGAFVNAVDESLPATNVQESEGEAAEPTVEEEPAAEPAVEEEPPAEAPPAAEVGTAANPMPQPYVAEGIFGGEKYSLTGRVVADAPDVTQWNMFNDPAPAGFKWVVVELTMTGIDKDGVEPSLASFDLSLSTPEGNQYNEELGLVLADGMPSMYEGPKLYPGSAFTGHMSFLVPADAAGFMLHDNGNYIAL